MNFAILILTILGIVSDLIELTYETGVFTRKHILPLAVMVYVVIEKMSIFAYSQTHRTLLSLRGIKRRAPMNGWKNYETWNISLWLQNDENLYSLCKEWVEHQVDFCYPVNYDIFRHTLNELCGETTPDGVRWDDESIDSLEVSEMMMEL